MQSVVEPIDLGRRRADIPPASKNEKKDVIDKLKSEYVQIK